MAARTQRWALAALMLVVAGCSYGQDSRSPIHLHRVANGNVEGLKSAIRVSVEACRAAKGLPSGGAIQLPSDGYLAKLPIVEVEEYFDGANHALYNTVRTVSADPTTSTCELRVFHERHGLTEQMCGRAFSGASKSLNKLTDVSHPEQPGVETSSGDATRKGCGKKVKPYDVAGIAQDDANGTACVWDSDVTAKLMKGAGMNAPGHKGSRGADFCLYAKQPIYVYNGHHEMVVVKSSGSTEGDVQDQLTGESSAYMNHRLVGFTDGTSIPPDRFSNIAVQNFLAQPAKTPLGDNR